MNARREHNATLISRLMALPREERVEAMRALTVPQRRALDADWWMWAQDAQFTPEGDWRIWLIRAGRGFGKTRAGAEWVSQIARERPEALIALVGATYDDARQVMVEGPAGLLQIAREGEAICFRRSSGEVHFASGARAFLFSADSPERLRGPQHDIAWCDELGKWRGKRGEAAWDNLMMGMRRGDLPQTLVTTTPRKAPLMQRVKAIKGLTETLGRTAENPHLPDSFVAAMIEEYAGTWLGRQELDGEMIDEVAGALWTRTTLEQCRVREHAELVRVVVGVDPPASASGDACGIVAVGLGRDGRGYAIEDASAGGLSPEGWARAVAACAARHRADLVVAEKNQGGDMVRSVLAAADSGLPIRLVSASRGKAARAEPVALLYEAGKMRHVGAFPELEDELCGLTIGGGYEGPGRSPDRADALVWAASELMLRRRGSARVRVVGDVERVPLRLGTKQ